MPKRKISKVGLTDGKMDWGANGWMNHAVAFWANKRFSGREIAHQTGLTVGQVYARCQRYGIRLNDARNGVGPDSEAVIGNYGLATITVSRKRQIMETYPDPTEYEE